MSESKVKLALEKGLANLINQDSDNEKEKVGYLRGGSSGIYDKASGLIIGECPRRSYLRMLGLKIEETSPETKLMFQAGIANEDQWYQTIKAGYPYKLLQEEEVATGWFTKKGTPVTGRPDLVLCSKDDKPEVGIELKLVSSAWTARDVLFEGRPKYQHLIQAAHYSWQLGIPFELWYTSRLKFASNDMIGRLLPKYGTAKYNQLKDFIEIRFYQMVVSKIGRLYGKQITEEQFLAGKQGYNEGQVYAAPLNINPFTIGYQLEWGKNGKLSWESLLTKERFETEITKERIRDYYELVDSLDQAKQLPPPPTNLKGDGTKAGYKMCQYCPLEKLCDTTSDKQKFLDKVKTEYAR